MPAGSTSNRTGSSDMPAVAAEARFSLVAGQERRYYIVPETEGWRRPVCEPGSQAAYLAELERSRLAAERALASAGNGTTSGARRSSPARSNVQR